MLVLRAWLPPLATVGPVRTASGHTVEFRPFFEEREGDKPAHYTVASLPWEGDDPDGQLAAAWNVLSECLSIVCFAEMSFSKVVAARAEQDVPAGVECTFRAYPTIPTASALCMPFGFPQRKRRVQETPLIKRPEVHAALTWLLRGLQSFDAFDRTMYLWICLEALTPPVKSAPTCDKCRTALACPQCGAPPLGYKVVAAIEQYLAPHLDRKAFRRLYELRSKIVHGQLSAGGEDADRVTQHAMTLTKLAIDVMKAELGWEQRSDPSIQLQGSTTNYLSIKTVQVCASDDSRLSPHLLSSEPVITDIPFQAAATQTPRRRRGK